MTLSKMTLGKIILEKNTHGIKTLGIVTYEKMTPSIMTLSITIKMQHLNDNKNNAKCHN
jgi:hypothetical protein